MNEEYLTKFTHFKDEPSNERTESSLIPSSGNASGIGSIAYQSTLSPTENR